MTVGLIDDDEDVLDSLRMVLESRSISVLCFKSAEAFLPTLAGGRPDCVVSDVRMPGLFGLDLQHELKARDAALPLIFITGHGDVAMAVAALKEGAFDFIEKPFDHGQLIASIGRAIEHNARSLSEQAG